MDDARTIALLGAGGTMGLGMARNLARAGLEVRAWNRTREKAEPLAQDGAEVFDAVPETVRGADVVITMLADADAVLEVAGEALEATGPGTVWLQTSTVGLDGFERCAQLAHERGVPLVDAPVLGTKQPAEEGKLVVLASGPEEQRERLVPVFDAIGQRTLWLGEPGNGSRLKLATNSWILAVVEGTAETVALAEGLGLDPQLVLDAVEGGPLDLPYLQMKARAIIARNFEPSFRLALAAKDARLVQEAARRAGLDLPLIESVRERFAQAADQHGDSDMSATYLASAAKGYRRS